MTSPSVRHRFNSLNPDDPNAVFTGEVQPQRDWNDEHVLLQGPMTLLGRNDTTAGPGPTVEIPISDIVSGTASAYVGDDPPPNPTPNQLWWSSELGQMFIWYDDTTSTQWVQVAPSALSVNTSVERSVSTSVDLANMTQPYPYVVESACRAVPGDGGGGKWTFATGDQSSFVSGPTPKDPAHALYVAPATDPTGATGAWRRLYDGPMLLRWFGAKGDGAADDKDALTNAFITHGLIPGVIDGENLVYATTGFHRLRYPNINLQNFTLRNLDHTTLNHTVLGCDIPFARFQGQIVGNTLTVGTFSVGSAVVAGMRINAFTGGVIEPCYVLSGSGTTWLVDGPPQTTPPIPNMLEGYSLANNLTLRNIKVDRNDLTMGSGTGLDSKDAATVNINGYNNVLVEDLEIWGNGCGKGLNIQNSTHVKVLRPYVHDMRWVLPANPGGGGEQISGIFFSNNGDTLLSDHRVTDIEGFVEPTPGATLIPQKGAAYIPVETPPGSNVWTITQTYQNTDGVGVASCWDTVVRNGYTANVGEGIDCSGSRSVNTLLLGNTYYDCNGFSEKTSSSQWKLTSIGARSYRAGLSAFIVLANASPAFPNDVTWHDAQAFDTGFYGAWADVAAHDPTPGTPGTGSAAKVWNVAGFSIQGDGNVRTRLMDCKSYSSTEKYSVYLPDTSGDYTISSFDGWGYTVAKFSGTTINGLITEFIHSPPGLQVWGELRGHDTIIGTNIHAGSTLTVDGTSTFARDVNVIGTNVNRFATFGFIGTSFNQLVVRYDDPANAVPVLASNHGLTGAGGAVQQRVTLARSNVAVGQVASMFETKAVLDWSNAANQTSELNLWTLSAGAGVISAKLDNTGIVTSLGLKSNAKTTTAGLGYATGAGNTAPAQTPGKTSSVNLNGMCGRFVMASGGGGVNSIPAGGTVAFNFNNTATLPSDYIAIKQSDNAGATFGAYAVFCKSTGVGTNQITVRNLTATALDEPVAIDFIVFRAVTA